MIIYLFFPYSTIYVWLTISSWTHLDTSMCCSSNNKNKQKRSVNIRVLFRIGSKWNPIQPSTLQKYHQFTVFRNLKKNESCVTRVGQRPTHAIGALNNFPFAGCIAISLSHAVQWKRMPKNLGTENLLSLFLGWQFRQLSEFSKTASGFLAFLFWFRWRWATRFDGTVLPAQNRNGKLTLKLKMRKMRKVGRMKRANIPLTSSTEIRGVIISSGNRHGFRWWVWLFFHFL